MKCPECGAESSVLETRGTRRRRRCRNGHRWSTDEVVADFRADMYERGQATRRANALQAEAGTANAYAEAFSKRKALVRDLKRLSDGAYVPPRGKPKTTSSESYVGGTPATTPPKTSAAALVRARLEAARCDRNDDDDY